MISESSKKILISGACIAFFAVAYYTFEPVFVYPFGWKPIPQEKGPRIVNIQDPELKDAIVMGQQILTEMHHSTKAPALSIAVGLDNRVIWSEARGYADIEHKIPANTKTTFRIGSVSKALSSVALGRLLEQGKLKLDDSVGQYIPYFSHPYISIRQLASHTSGIRNYGWCFCFPVWEAYSNDPFQSIEESIAIFNDDPLLFEPGSSFGYSTYNYTLLSAVLEEVSGRIFLDLMQEEVFTPSGMVYTSADYADRPLTNSTISYEISGGEYKEVFPVDNSNKWAGGGLRSTPTELVKLGNTLLNGTILQKETIEVLSTPQLLANGSVNEQNYALGWRNDTFKLFEGEKQVRILHHGGTALGSTALLVLIPEYQLTMAIAINKHKQESSFEMFEYLLPIVEQLILHMEN